MTDLLIILAHVTGWMTGAYVARSITRKKYEANLPAWYTDTGSRRTGASVKVRGYSQP